MNNQWAQSGNNFMLREVSQNKKLLKTAIYKVEENGMTGELYLSQVMDKFEFPYKIYGIEDKFINRVKLTYDNTVGNLGILLNGVKGTGKTVTSKQVCNALELPVILVSHPFQGLPNFINEIQQNVVIFIDEYEKIYSERDHSVLTVMDGALDNGYRKVFLLTTNNLYVNENLLERPGRIRYLKTYGNLSVEVITEIVDDKLIHPELRKVTIDFIAQLQTITVDIVKAIIDEVNIHNEDPKEFKDVFNIKIMDSKYNVYELIPGKKDPVTVALNCRVNPSPKFENKMAEGNWDFEANRTDYGNIINVIDDVTVVVEDWDIGEDGSDVKTIKTYVVEEVKQYHYGYAF